jgi:hypothetical protein
MPPQERPQRPGRHEDLRPQGRIGLGADRRQAVDRVGVHCVGRGDLGADRRGIRGFVVPTDTPGFTATPIEPKLSMRASIQFDISLDDVRLPADATGRPDRVCNLHFFNPALVMKCVEVVRGPDTSDGTVETSVNLARRLGKVPEVLAREIPGFIAKRILGAVRDEAIFLLENGIATVEDIDTACRTALGYPMGPFELMDLTGIDIGYLTKKDRFAASGDPKDQPSKSVSALVERGELGRKTERSGPAVRARDLDWTIIRPGGLLASQATRLVTVGEKVPRGNIPRADVARR